ncbi:MAG TPA: hypothetical protein VMJ75_01770 [Candidatus Acidoferrales bacterium]|nr:hypothetical protein [Candidatus Acidoferrales bacterium]
MATTRPPYLPVNPETRYEHSDISSRHVALAGAGILLGTWIFVSLLYFYYDALDRHRAATAAAPPARAAGQALAPPQPRLEVSPTRDLAGLRAQEDAELNRYRWVDKQRGIVSIPIERAMELIANQGIPAQKAPPNTYGPPLAGSRQTGLEGKVEPESR